MYPTYTHLMFLLAAFMFGMLVGGWLLSAYIRWSEQLGDLGCDDPTEPVTLIETAEYPDVSWHNASVKAHHAEAEG